MACCCGPSGCSCSPPTAVPGSLTLSFSNVVARGQTSSGLALPAECIDDAGIVAWLEDIAIVMPLLLSTQSSLSYYGTAVISSPFSNVLVFAGVTSNCTRLNLYWGFCPSSPACIPFYSSSLTFDLLINEICTLGTKQQDTNFLFSQSIGDTQRDFSIGGFSGTCYANPLFTPVETRGFRGLISISPTPLP